MAVVKTKPEVGPIKWTEKLAQNAIARDCYYRQHLLTTPNMHAFPYYECDLISITKSFFAHVFEIKISRSDFLSEFGEGRAQSYKLDRLREWGGDDPMLKGPNYFWLAAPANIFEPEEVPPWMGVMILKRNTYGGILITEEIRRAKRLHGEKSSTEFLYKIGTGLSARYWQARA